MGCRSSIRWLWISRSTVSTGSPQTSHRSRSPQPHRSTVSCEKLRSHYGPVLYRVLYRRSKNLFILLHILRKNTGNIPASDIDTAQLRWQDFKARMDAQPRRPPRAAGHDAP